MKPKPHSEEHTRFENLLRLVVSVPKAEVDRRMADDRATKEWAKENDQPAHRARPIVSPAAVGASRSRKP
jgi:hypothetical protein